MPVWCDNPATSATNENLSCRCHVSAPKVSMAFKPAVMRNSRIDCKSVANDQTSGSEDDRQRCRWSDSRTRSGFQHRVEDLVRSDFQRAIRERIRSRQLFGKQI